MNIESLLERVPARYRAEFSRFLDSGEASPEFLAFLDSDSDCQKLVDLAMTQQASELRGFVQALAHSSHVPLESQRSPAILESALASTLGEVLHCEPAVRMQVVEGAVAQLAKAETGMRAEARKLFEALGKSAHANI